MRVTLVPAPITLPISHDRSVGIHVSRIIAAMAVEAGILKSSTAAALDLQELGGDAEAWWASLGTSDRIRIFIGLAWEQWYIPRLLDVIDHPGELCFEGVFLTPDGEGMDVILTERDEEGFILALHEVKATYKSINTVGNPFESQWMWTSQCMAYAKAMGTTRTYLHVLFLCGDYKYPITPSIGPDKERMLCWRADFDQEEIDERWDTLMSYVRHRQSQAHEDAMRDTEE